MKKNKKIALVKESKKLAKKELENQIVEALTSIIGKFEQKEKKVTKLISKNAKQLAGKLAKQLTLNTAKITTPVAETSKVTKKSIAKTPVEAQTEETLA